MSKVITVNIQKGGVGKTTTTHELAANLTKLGYKVLCVDLDQQSNLSRISGAELSGYYTVYDTLKNECEIEDCIQHMNNYDIAIAHKKLKDADKEFTALGDVYKLTDKIEPVKGKYDYIIIDTPPSVVILPSMALTAADYVLIPVEASSSGIQGLTQLFDMIDVIRHPKRGTNKDLKVVGMLLTMYKFRTLFAKSMRSQLKQKYQDKGIKIFDTYIRDGVAVDEAQAWKKSLIEYDPKSKPAKDYADFTQELLKEIN